MSLYAKLQQARTEEDVSRCWTYHQQLPVGCWWCISKAEAITPTAESFLSQTVYYFRNGCCNIPHGMGSSGGEPQHL